MIENNHHLMSPALYPLCYIIAWIFCGITFAQVADVIKLLAGVVTVASGVYGMILQYYNNKEKKNKP